MPVSYTHLDVYKRQELYNNGIVDVSYKYEKMYVIRPQFFIPMITLLRNAALNSLQYKQELQVVKNQQIDILHFEENMNAFKEGFEMCIRDRRCTIRCHLGGNGVEPLGRFGRG